MVWSCAEKGEEYKGKRIIEDESTWKEGERKTKKANMDAVKDGMKETGLREWDATDRTNWRRLILCGDP